MVNLDSVQEIQKIDKKNLIESIYDLTGQVKQAWEEVTTLEITQDYSEIKNIVVAGMGGSALPGRIVDSFLFDRIRVPIEVSTDFSLPNYVNSSTLVIVSSYSGGTAETIECYHAAKKKNAKIFGITTGGKLGELLKEDNIDGYIFDPVKNPSGQPRMSLGYGITSLLAFLSRFDFAQVTKEEMFALEEFVQKQIISCRAEIKEETNLAKMLAKKLFRKEVMLVTAEHLVGISHAFKNQLNENAKTLAFLFDLPELNHHLLEGLKNPVQVKESLVTLFFESSLFKVNIKKNLPATKEIFDKQEIEVVVVPLGGKTKLEQIFEVLVLGSFVSYYLAILYEIDPTPIPWVKYLKDSSKT